MLIGHSSQILQRHPRGRAVLGIEAESPTKVAYHIGIWIERTAMQQRLEQLDMIEQLTARHFRSAEEQTVTAASQVL
jgi:hypothetical protein